MRRLREIIRKKAETAEADDDWNTDNCWLGSAQPPATTKPSSMVQVAALVYDQRRMEISSTLTR